MTPRKTIFALGLLLIIVPLPVFGFPQTWKNVFYVAAGLGLALGAFISYIRAHAPRQSPPFPKKPEEDNPLSTPNS